MPFEVGQRVSDYEILAILGKGGMGRVYQVRNVISNRIEAMKVLLADLAAEPELGDRFGGEIRTLARLDHPNIAKLHTALTVENQLVMIMEYVEGVTLSERARQSGLPLNDVLSLMAQTLAALGYAHANGVIHRDIKPSNIMVTPHGLVKLMDFGIAKSNTDTMHTRAGTTMGSMLYMSPEQVRGTTVDARSDLYSIGVVLYELTAGRRPFESESTYAVLEAQLNAAPRPPVELNSALPKPLNDIIMTALEKDPACRFQSAEAFRKALESLKTPQAAALPPTLPVTASAAPPVAAAAAPRAVRTGSHRGLWMALGAVACVLVLIAAAIAMPHFWHGSAATKKNAPDAESKAQVTPSPAPAVVNSPTQPAADNPAPPPPQPVADSTPPHQPVNAISQPVKKPAHTKVDADLTNQSAGVQPSQPAHSSGADTPAPAVQSPVPPPGPSREEVDKVQETLMQMHSRADAVRASVNSLRRAQAADGLELSPEIAGASSRLDNYLQAADRAAQNNDLPAARRYIDSAEKQLAVLEAKFGR